MLFFCRSGGSLRKREYVQRQPNNHNPPPSKLEIHCSGSPLCVGSISTYKLVIRQKKHCEQPKVACMFQSFCDGCKSAKTLGGRLSVASINSGHLDYQAS